MGNLNTTRTFFRDIFFSRNINPPPDPKILPFQEQGKGIKILQKTGSWEFFWAEII